MKLVYAIFVPLVWLDLGVLVSGQSISEALNELLDKDKAAQNYATTNIAKQFSSVLDEIDKELYQTLIPMLNQKYNDIKDYVKDLETHLTASGYDSTDCIKLVDAYVKNISSIASITNVTAKAIEEKQTVYEHILYNVYLIGKNNIDMIHGEADSISNEYYVCIRTDHPEYCNRTLYRRAIAKQEEIPKLYNKETEIAKANLIQQGLIYKNRVQDYVNEVIMTAKPYLSLLEICAQRILSVRKKYIGNRIKSIFCIVNSK
ncbi:hypothetical protein NQ314_019931 [Rhamnusium bicolor]|uniref:Uncharacterized protein n=1 Tax=Rhamnusium bicolor TaxID=1586634 RepID=A0AAV8WM82_9CUCU|nr:hypothetical protein NQ314_019931 [Rhamnusium bicolor]